MKIAAFHHQGQPGVGLVSADLSSVQPFDLSTAERALGALPVIERLAAGQGLPALLPAIAMSALSLTAPLPKPRRNMFAGLVDAALDDLDARDFAPFKALSDMPMAMTAPIRACFWLKWGKCLSYLHA